jgi:outer membrane lipoprotein SlyB
MQRSAGMRHRVHLSLLTAIVAATAGLGCATTTTTTTTWSATDSGFRRTGRVETVQEIVQRVEGNPTAGAIAGALIGGFLFRGDHPATILGAAAGAAIGASASSGAAETRTYHVLVQFDDGSRGVFVFGGFSPFRPGDPVMLTSRGLYHQ